jgi:cytochrome c biogenesis protein CcmG/thiol:disulfide interchange protein DsbE
MSRRQLLGFVVVLALIGGGLLLRGSGGSSTGSKLPGLRRTAALQPCPAGLGPELPHVTLPCLGGGPKVALSASGPGRPMLVNIWGSWCHPCTAEVPDLVRFTAKAGDKVGLVGVDTEDDPVNALTFAAQLGMRWPSVVDDDKVVLRSYGSGPPVTLFVDAAGHVTYTQRGQFHSLAEIEALVAKHLGVTL